MVLLIPLQILPCLLVLIYEFYECWGDYLLGEEISGGGTTLDGETKLISY